jgi:pimeloyl-ACP methyl ester carboxylesterase
MQQLEVITRTPEGKARPTPLLFVHGAYGGAWLWDEHFLPYFAERGWVAHALSMRGHAGSDGSESVRYARLRNYVADVEQVADGLPAPPVLIGHSLGGMVVQHCLHRGPAPAAVLMASSPPHGMIGSMVDMALSNPQLMYELGFAHHLGPQLTDGRAIERALFSRGLPEPLVRSYMRRFQAESDLVVLDLLFLDLPPSTPMLDLPVLVLGAEKDSFVTYGGLETTADTYRTKAEIFPGMRHAMMLDLGWESVAARIHAWLEETLVERSESPVALLPYGSVHTVEEGQYTPG